MKTNVMNMATQGKCEICDRTSKTIERHNVALWDYGHRSIHSKLMCAECRGAEERGEL